MQLTDKIQFSNIDTISKSNKDLDPRRLFHYHIIVLHSFYDRDPEEYFYDFISSIEKDCIFETIISSSFGDNFQLNMIIKTMPTNENRIKELLTEYFEDKFIFLPDYITNESRI